MNIECYNYIKEYDALTSALIRDRVYDNKFKDDEEFHMMNLMVESMTPPHNLPLIQLLEDAVSDLKPHIDSLVFSRGDNVSNLRIVNLFYNRVSIIFYMLRILQR